MPGGSATDVLGDAVRAERLRSARIFNSLRLIGITMFFAMVVVMGDVLGQSGWTVNRSLFIVYWTIALLFWWLARRSNRAALAMGVAIALFDMPAVLLLQLNALPQADAGFVVGSTAGLYALLVMAAMATLKAREVLLATAVGILLEGVIVARVGFAVPTFVIAMMMLVLAGGACVQIIGRVRRLVEDVAAEQ